MKSKIDLKSMVLGALLGLVIALAVAAATPSGMPLEYKVVVGSVADNHINKVVNSHITDGRDFVPASHHADREIFVVLKRAKR